LVAVIGSDRGNTELFFGFKLLEERLQDTGGRNTPDDAFSDVQEFLPSDMGSVRKTLSAGNAAIVIF
jgi:hypothetical protein